jgi:hypothetical protein
MMIPVLIAAGIMIHPDVTVYGPTYAVLTGNLGEESGVTMDLQSNPKRRNLKRRTQRSTWQ